MDFEHPRTYHFYKLESESSLSNEDTESVNSFQEIETDLVRDSSDTERNHSEYELEFEVGSTSESDLITPPCTSGDSDLDHDMFIAAAAAICDTSFDNWVTDGEDSDLSSSEENSYVRTGFWTCVKCKSKKNNPLFSYCEKCFQDRKTLFPPRPKPKKPKKTKKNEPPVKLATLQFCLKGLSQDSGIASSQECCPPLGLDKIVIPDHLTENASCISSVCTQEGIPSGQQTPDDENSKSSTSKQVTLNDITKVNSTRKRQLSESSVSDSETKRPRWRNVKKSPRRDQSPNSLSNSPTRKRKSTSCEPVRSVKKLKSSELYESQSSLISQSEDDVTGPQKSISSNGNSASQESIDVCGKTSDLGSEISSGSGFSEKAEEELPLVPLVSSKELCMFCNIEPINAGFLHGNLAHRCCCYQCAKKTWKKIKRCPLCNRKVSNVIRVY